MPEGIKGINLEDLEAALKEEPVTAITNQVNEVVPVATTAESEVVAESDHKWVKAVTLFLQSAGIDIDKDDVQWYEQLKVVTQSFSELDADAQEQIRGKAYTWLAEWLSNPQSSLADALSTEAVIHFIAIFSQAKSLRTSAQNKQLEEFRSKLDDLHREVKKTAQPDKPTPEPAVPVAPALIVDEQTTPVVETTAPAVKQSEQQLRPSEVANALGISGATLRRWSSRFSAFLDQPTEETVSHRRYSQGDLETLGQIKTLLDEGWTYEQVDRQLAEKQASGVAPFSTTVASASAEAAVPPPDSIEPSTPGPEKPPHQKFEQVIHDFLMRGDGERSVQVAVVAEILADHVSNPSLEALFGQEAVNLVAVGSEQNPIQFQDQILQLLSNRTLSALGITEASWQTIAATISERLPVDKPLDFGFTNQTTLGHLREALVQQGFLDVKAVTPEPLPAPEPSLPPGSASEPGSETGAEFDEDFDAESVVIVLTRGEDSMFCEGKKLEDFDLNQMVFYVTYLATIGLFPEKELIGVRVDSYFTKNPTVNDTLKSFLESLYSPDADVEALTDQLNAVVQACLAGDESQAPIQFLDGKTAEMGQKRLAAVVRKLHEVITSRQPAEKPVVEPAKASEFDPKAKAEKLVSEVFTEQIDRENVTPENLAAIVAVAYEGVVENTTEFSQAYAVALSGDQLAFFDCRNMLFNPESESVNVFNRLANPITQLISSAEFGLAEGADWQTGHDRLAAVLTELHRILSERQRQTETVPVMDLRGQPLQDTLSATELNDDTRLYLDRLAEREDGAGVLKEIRDKAKSLNVRAYADELLENREQTKPTADTPDQYLAFFERCVQENDFKSIAAETILCPYPEIRKNGIQILIDHDRTGELKSILEIFEDNLDKYQGEAVKVTEEEIEVVRSYLETQRKKTDFIRRFYRLLRNEDASKQDQIDESHPAWVIASIVADELSTHDLALTKEEAHWRSLIRINADIEDIFKAAERAEGKYENTLTFFELGITEGVWKRIQQRIQSRFPENSFSFDYVLGTNKLSDFKKALESAGILPVRKNREYRSLIPKLGATVSGWLRFGQGAPPTQELPPAGGESTTAEVAARPEQTPVPSPEAVPSVRQRVDAWLRSRPDSQAVQAIRRVPENWKMKIFGQSVKDAFDVDSILHMVDDGKDLPRTYVHYNDAEEGEIEKTVENIPPKEWAKEQAKGFAKRFEQTKPSVENSIEKSSIAEHGAMVEALANFESTRTDLVTLVRRVSAEGGEVVSQDERRSVAKAHDEAMKKLRSALNTATPRDSAQLNPADTAFVQNCTERLARDRMILMDRTFGGIEGYGPVSLKRYELRNTLITSPIDESTIEPLSVERWMTEMDRALTDGVRKLFEEYNQGRNTEEAVAHLRELQRQVDLVVSNHQQLSELTEETLKNEQVFELLRKVAGIDAILSS